MSAQPDEELELVYGRASLSSGLLEGARGGASTAELMKPLDNLTAAAPELLQVDAGLDFSTLFASLGSRERTCAFQELTLISAQHVYVVQRDRAAPETGRVAVTRHARKLGLLLSVIRRHLSARDPNP
jgi:hypothetical protein